VLAGQVGDLPAGIGALQAVPPVLADVLEEKAGGVADRVVADVSGPSRVVPRDSHRDVLYRPIWSMIGVGAYAGHYEPFRTTTIEAHTLRE
jgi:hypothetical protein